MVDARPGRRLSTATTAPARCWCSPPPTSRTSSSRAPGPAARRWRASSSRSSALLAENRWPFRLHATYDETITPRPRRVREGQPRHARSTACTGSSTTPRRSPTATSTASRRSAAASPSSTAWPTRASTSSSATAPRRPSARRRSQRMLEAGVPVGAGTDATRVASLQPLGLAVLAGHRQDASAALRSIPQRNRLDRETALRLWTEGSTWFSSEEGKKGQIEAGPAGRSGRARPPTTSPCPEDEIQDIASVLTVVGGKLVHGAGDFADLAPPLPPADAGLVAGPDLSAATSSAPATARRANTPSRQRPAAAPAPAASTATPMPAPGAPTRRPPTRRSFWGALGCSCWAF